MSATREAVAKALHEWEFGVEPCDVETTGAIDCQPTVMNELADAAITAFESNPPAWLIRLVEYNDLGCNGHAHGAACSAVPESVRIAAGITP